MTISDETHTLTRHISASTCTSRFFFTPTAFSFWSEYVQTRSSKGEENVALWGYSYPRHLFTKLTPETLTRKVSCQCHSLFVRARLTTIEMPSPQGMNMTDWLGRWSPSSPPHWLALSFWQNTAIIRFTTQQSKIKTPVRLESEGGGEGSIRLTTVWHQWTFVPKQLGRFMWYIFYLFIFLLVTESWLNSSGQQVDQTLLTTCTESSWIQHELWRQSGWRSLYIKRTNGSRGAGVTLKHKADSDCLMLKMRSSSLLI